MDDKHETEISAIFRYTQLKEKFEGTPGIEKIHHNENYYYVTCTCNGLMMEFASLDELGAFLAGWRENREYRASVDGAGKEQLRDEVISELNDDLVRNCDTRIRVGEDGYFLDPWSGESRSKIQDDMASEIGADLYTNHKLELIKDGAGWRVRDSVEAYPLGDNDSWVGPDVQEDPEVIKCHETYNVLESLAAETHGVANVNRIGSTGEYLLRTSQPHLVYKFSSTEALSAFMKGVTFGNIEGRRRARDERN